MSNDAKDTTQEGMDPRDDEALWQLLGRAEPVDVSPYFSRRVLREVTLSGETRRAGGGWLSGLRRMWRRPRTAAAVWPGAAVVAGFWLAVVMTTSPSGQGGAGHRSWQTSPGTGADPIAVETFAQADEQADAAEEVAPQDVEVIADLDNLIAREENRLWTEDTARF